MAARGQNQGKRKNKLAYAPEPKITPPPKKEDPTKDSIYHQCIFTIELYTSPNKSWVYDTGCGTHICNATQGLRASRKLKPSALSLYVGNGQRAEVEDHGIIAHRTPPYTPQHNGVSEKRNITLLDMVRSMMSQTTLPNSFWDYTLETAERILNMVPTKKVEKTPYDGLIMMKTFSFPVADIRAIRILIAIAAYHDYEIWKMDVKTSFLNRYLFEEVYMEQPKGFVNPKYLNRVCKLKRSIYRLKQASRQWNKRFNDEINKFGFTQNCDEPCVYLKASGSNVTFLILYVDDILIMGNNIPMLQDVKSYLGRCFAMKDLGEAELRVSCYTYAGYLTDVDDLMSQTGYVFILNRGVVDWKSAKQSIFATSSAEAEYIAAYDASKEAV
ncbi:retrovirus-related pol polyprotein from transposon TNT 1-94 [Tanacetum coccineum]